MAMWKVVEEYFGKHIDSKCTLCTCDTIEHAASIIDGLVLLRKGRPFKFTAVCIKSFPKDPLVYDDILGNHYDFRKYLKGLFSLN